jgi:amino acid adenylation domain-containing protein
MTRLLQNYLESQAERRPESAALVWEDRLVTYAVLEQSSNRLARALTDLRCRRGDRVALLIPKSDQAIIAIFAALKAGCAYVPLDVSSPPARLSRIVGQCEPRVIFASRSTAPLLSGLLESEAVPRDSAAIWIDEPAPLPKVLRSFDWADADSFSSHSIESQGESSDAAHILFTSGSTGVPKGVIITHSNVICFVDWALAYFGTQPEDRISGHPPLYFDLSTFDIYATIGAGAELHLLSPELSLLPHRLADFIRDRELTQWFSVPSILHHLAKSGALRDRDFPSLRRLLWCGEKFPMPALIQWMTRVPHARFVNLYGPTEATIASGFYHVAECPQAETDEIPIGRACDGEQLLILDSDLQPTATNEPGDLYIAGVGLSPGYWRDPEKTAAAFLTRDGERIYKTGDLARVGEDGNVYLLGRADSQIKSRGYRIELGEIEAALHALPEIRDAAVVAIEAAGFEGAVICCAFVAAEGADASPLSLRKQLARSLPSYMLPARWMALARLPLNGNGKVARPELKQRFLGQISHAEVTSNAV